MQLQFELIHSNYQDRNVMSSPASVMLAFKLTFWDSLCLCEWISSSIFCRNGNKSNFSFIYSYFRAVIFIGKGDICSSSLIWWWWHSSCTIAIPLVKLLCYYVHSVYSGMHMWSITWITINNKYNVITSPTHQGS